MLPHAYAMVTPVIGARLLYGNAPEHGGITCTLLLNVTSLHVSQEGYPWIEVSDVAHFYITITILTLLSCSFLLVSL